MVTARGRDVKDYAGLHDDDKPTNAANGALFLEIDTGDIYAFDAENAEWNKLGGSSSGGSDDDGGGK